MEKIKSNTIDHKDYMRMAMLKHEETFKEQVYELHRLYQMQKALMQSVGIGQQKQERVPVETNIKGFTIDYNNNHQGGQMGDFKYNKLQQQSNVTINNVQRVANPIAKIVPAQEQILDDDCEIELTLSLGPSTQNPRRKRANSGHESLSSSSSGSSQTRKTSPKTSNNTTSLQLTRGGDHQFTWGNSNNFTHGSDLEPGFSNGQSNNSNSPWLFQALSLKST